MFIRQKRGVFVSLAVILLLSGCGPQEGGESTSEDSVGGENAIVSWNRIAHEQVVVVARKNSQAAGQYMAYVNVAMFEAANAIARAFTPYTQPALTAPAGSSSDAAVAAAARYVLLQKLPAQATAIEAAYADALAQIADGTAKTNGIAVGEAAGARIMANRANDNVEANDPVTLPPPGPGVWQPLPGQTPLAPWTRHAQPWTMTSVDQFRAGPPLPLNSFRYAIDYNEVKTLGCTTCTARTADQTEVGMFWSENTLATWGRALQTLAVEQNLNLIDSARFFALAYMAISDGATACWDSKFTYFSWRPEVAVHQADTDGNFFSNVDAAWVPQIPTPAHPDWPSGHGCQTGGVSKIIRGLFGPNVHFTADSRVTNTVHSYSRWDGALREVIDARVWTGIHTRTADEVGAHIGMQVGYQAFDNYLRPVRSGHRSSSVETESSEGE